MKISYSCLEQPHQILTTSLLPTKFRGQFIKKSFTLKIVQYGNQKPELA